MCAISTIWGMSMQHSCMTVHKFKFRNTFLLADVALKARVGSTHSVGCAGGKESMAPWQSKIDEVTWCDGLLGGTTSLDCKYMHETTRQQANSWRWWVGELSQPFACELWVNHWLSKSRYYEICNSYFNVKVSCSRQTWVHSMLIFWVHVSWKVRVHAKSTGERFCSSTILRLRVGNSHVKPWLSWLETTRGFEFLRKVQDLQWQMKLVGYIIDLDWWIIVVNTGKGFAIFLDKPLSQGMKKTTVVVRFALRVVPRLVKWFLQLPCVHQTFAKSTRRFT